MGSQKQFSHRHSEGGSRHYCTFHFYSRVCWEFLCAVASLFEYLVLISCYIKARPRGLHYRW